MLSYDIIDEITEYCEKLKNVTLVSKKYHEITKRKILYKIEPEFINKKFHYKLKMNYENFVKLNEIYYDRIIILDLSNNELTSIPESLENCVQLQTLFLFDNNLTSIPESIKNIKGIKIER